MRKSRILMVFVLALAIAGSAFAQGLNFKGFVENYSKWDKANGLQSQNNVELQMGLTAGGGDKVKAVVQIQPWKLNGTDVFGSTEDLTKNLSLAVSKMYIEANGPFWNGGPDMVTRLGDLDISYNPWVAEMSREGISISDLNLAGYDLGAFYLWDATGQAQGLKAQGYIGPVDSAVTVVNSDDETAVGLDAVVSPLKNLALKAALSANFEDDTNEMQKAIKLDGAMQVTDKTLVNAGFRTVDADFDPVYRSHAKDQWGNPINPVDLYKGQTGFNVGVQTEVKDVNLAASYDQPTALGKIGANTDIGGFRLAAGTELNVNGVTEISLRKTTASVEKDFAGEKTAITGRYEVAVEPAKAVKSKVSANAKTNLIESLPNLGLGASVEFDNFGENPVAEVKADYTAPNGLTIKGGYNTAKGAVAEAGVRVNF